MIKFICTSCGACCRSVGKLGGEKLGLPVKKDGSCGHLVGNKCSIYETRPDICRVDKLHFKKMFQSRKDYYIETTKECHKLIDEQGLDESYKVDLKEYD
tara:strand:+ start:68 stop:364 length:297 start_codon:yes stop_codon:yes gene_type:complete